MCYKYLLTRKNLLKSEKLIEVDGFKIYNFADVYMALSKGDEDYRMNLEQFLKIMD